MEAHSFSDFLRALYAYATPLSHFQPALQKWMDRHEKSICGRAGKMNLWAHDDTITKN